MKRLALLLLLAGCSDQNKLWRESEIHDIAEDAAVDSTAELASRVAELEDQVERQQKYIDTVSGAATAALNANMSVAKQVDENARVANENALREMNRRGACGYRSVNRYNEAGQIIAIVNEKIPCTMNDLQK